MLRRRGWKTRSNGSSKDYPAAIAAAGRLLDDWVREREAEDFGFREAGIIGHRHDDGVGQRTRVEGDSFVLENGGVGVEGECEDRRSEGWHGPGRETG